LITLYSLYLWQKGRLEEKPWVLKALLWSIPLPYIANTSGWFMAEIGRQPWIVQGLQRVNEAVSPAVSAGAVLTTMLSFTLIYGILAMADIYLLTKFIKQGPGALPGSSLKETQKEVSLWS